MTASQVSQDALAEFGGLAFDTIHKLNSAIAEKDATIASLTRRIEELEAKQGE